MAEFGHVVNVKWQWNGTEIKQDYPTGTTVLEVANPARFVVGAFVHISLVSTAPYIIQKITDTTVEIGPGLREPAFCDDLMVIDSGGQASRTWLAEVITRSTLVPLEVIMAYTDQIQLPEGEPESPVPVTLTDSFSDITGYPGQTVKIPVERLDVENLPTGARVFRQDTKPTGGKEGDVWYDSNDGFRVYVHDGTDFRDTQDTTLDEISDELADAIEQTQALLDASAVAQGIADGSIAIFFQSAMPWAAGSDQSSGAIGDLWFDTDDGTLFRWNGSDWIEIADNTIVTALAAARAAQGAADGKITSFYGATVPTSLARGDLWINSADQNRLYRATFKGATSIGVGWVDARDILATNASAAVTGQSTNPYFDQWPDANPLPDGFNPWVGLPVKETSKVLMRTEPYSIRFSPNSSTNVGMYCASVMDKVSPDQYITVTLEFMLLSGGMKGAGVLVDWSDGTTVWRAPVILADHFAAPTFNRWYTLTKVVKRPAGAINLNSVHGYLMGNWDGFDGVRDAKDIIFDRLDWRPASPEEIIAYESPEALKAARDLAASKNKTYRSDEKPWPDGSNAHDFDFGDTWIDTDNGNLQSTWTLDRMWTPYKLGSQATSFDVIAGKVVPIGTETKLAWGVADPIDSLIGRTGGLPPEYPLPSFPDDGTFRSLERNSPIAIRKYGTTFYLFCRIFGYSQAAGSSTRKIEIFKWQQGEAAMTFVAILDENNYGKVIGSQSYPSVLGLVLVGSEWWDYRDYRIAYTNVSGGGVQANVFIIFRAWNQTFTSFRTVESANSIITTGNDPQYPFMFFGAMGVDGTKIIARIGSGSASSNIWATFDTSNSQWTSKLGGTAPGSGDRTAPVFGQLIRGTYGSYSDVLGCLDSSAGTPVLFNPTTFDLVGREPDRTQVGTGHLAVWSGSNFEWVSLVYSYVVTPNTWKVYKTYTDSRSTPLALKLRYSLADTSTAGDGMQESKASPGSNSSYDVLIPPGMNLFVRNVSVPVGTDVDQPDSIYLYGLAPDSGATSYRRMKKTDGTYPSKVPPLALLTPVDYFSPYVPTDSPEPLSLSTFDQGTSGLLTSDKGGFRLFGDGTGLWPHLEKRLKVEYDSRYSLSGHNHASLYAAKAVELQQHQGGSAAVTTNSSGQATITFPVAYPTGSTVIVLCTSMGDEALTVVPTPSVTSFVVSVKTRGSTAALANTSVRVLWHAMIP